MPPPDTQNLPYIGRNLFQVQKHSGFAAIRHGLHFYFREQDYLFAWNFRKNDFKLYSVDSNSYLGAPFIPDENIRLDELKYKSQVYLQAMYQRYLDGYHN